MCQVLYCWKEPDLKNTRKNAKIMNLIGQSDYRAMNMHEMERARTEAKSAI